MFSLLKNCDISLVEGDATAGTSTLTSDVLDMQGWDGVAFIAVTGDVTDTSVLTLTALDDTDDNVSGATAITGAAATFTANASTADEKLLIVDVYRPQKRYVHCTLARATANAVVGGIIAIRYRGKKLPITQGSTVVASAFAVGS